jgi:hypothetical protein
MLLMACDLVGDAFGTRADCAAAAAMLHLTAENLGFELTPRPVSLYARQLSTGTEAVMGPRATALVPESERDRLEDMRPMGVEGNPGHMVLTSEEPRMLFDPNLRQLGGYGIPAPSLAIRIKSTHPEDGGWTADLPDLKLAYLVDDDNDVLRPRYDGGLTSFAAEARRLAQLIRQGKTAAQIHSAMRRG